MVNLGGMAWEALEKPDTRHVSLLPSSVEAVQLELPVGAQQVLLESVRDDGSLAGDPITLEVDVEDGRNSYVVCVSPPRDPGRYVVLPSQ